MKYTFQFSFLFHATYANATRGDCTSSRSQVLGVVATSALKTYIQIAKPKKRGLVAEVPLPELQRIRTYEDANSHFSQPSFHSPPGRKSNLQQNEVGASANACSNE